MASEEAVLQIQHKYLLLQVRARELGPVLATRQCGECQYQDKARHGCSGQLSRAQAWKSNGDEGATPGCGKRQQAQLPWQKSGEAGERRRSFGSNPTPPVKNFLSESAPARTPDRKKSTGSTVGNNQRTTRRWATEDSRRGSRSQGRRQARSRNGAEETVQFPAHETRANG